MVDVKVYSTLEKECEIKKIKSRTVGINTDDFSTCCGCHKNQQNVFFFPVFSYFPAECNCFNSNFCGNSFKCGSSNFSCGCQRQDGNNNFMRNMHYKLCECEKTKKLCEKEKCSFSPKNNSDDSISSCSTVTAETCEQNKCDLTESEVNVYAEQLLENVKECEGNESDITLPTIKQDDIFQSTEQKSILEKLLIIDKNEDLLRGKRSQEIDSDVQLHINKSTERDDDVLFFNIKNTTKSDKKNLVSLSITTPKMQRNTDKNGLVSINIATPKNSSNSKSNEDVNKFQRKTIKLPHEEQTKRSPRIITQSKIPLKKNEDISSLINDLVKENCIADNESRLNKLLMHIGKEKAMMPPSPKECKKWKSSVQQSTDKYKSSVKVIHEYE